MIERNYENDLQSMLNDIERIKSKISVECQSIYRAENLFFNEQCFRSIDGDIHAKVLGFYLERILNIKPEYEKKLVGRMRGDIFLKGKTSDIIIEVKSHGTFSYADLEKQFKKLTENYPNSKHLYVAFRERTGDFIPNTEKILKQFNVESFFLTTYDSDPKVAKKYPETLKRLVETITAFI
ncbi:MAG: hypothetical protein ABSD92_04400 [Candidatus Bathyarchaeia archaeon]